jgi:hypothetical protein
MRIAAALIIFADRIDYRIFASIYIGAPNDDIREFLLRHTDMNVNREIAY